jgi:hypothetical protein
VDGMWTHIYFKGRLSSTYGKARHVPTVVSISWSVYLIRHLYILLMFPNLSRYQCITIPTDCNEMFRTPRQLIKHKRSDHANDTALRPTAEPSAATVSPEPVIQQIPKTIPFHVHEYSHIQPASITQQRHELIMPSVSRFPDVLHSRNF